MNEVEYVNGFSCAVDDTGMETVIVVQRTLPVIDGNGDFAGTEDEVVATLVMTSSVANNLYDALGEILNRNTPLY